MANVSGSASLPPLPLPPPLKMAEPESFAHFTLTHRWPAVVQRLLDENGYSAAVRAELVALQTELLTGAVRSLRRGGIDDGDLWQAELQPYVGQSWQQMPWWLAEVYFYRRILEAVQYFEPGDGQGVDPFGGQKLAELQSLAAQERSTSGQMNQWHDQLRSPSFDRRLPEATSSLSEALPLLFYHALGGNQADLSLNPMATVGPASRLETFETDRILVNDVSPLVHHLLAQRQDRIDVIADNAGSELLGDLALADFLLMAQITQRVDFHLKIYPTFVSDATIADVHALVAHLMANSDQSVQRFGQRLQNYLATNQLLLKTDPFWTAPLAFWQLPPPLKADLAQSDLVVIKGDANYRRLLGDRQWNYTTPFGAIVQYFPTALVAIRTLKSEVVAGLAAKQIAQLQATDPHWLTQGRWGVIQRWIPAQENLGVEAS